MSIDRSKPYKMDSDIKIAKRFRAFRGSRIIPAAASHRFTFPSFFPSKNKSRSDAISVTTSVISIEFVHNHPENASSFVSLPVPRHSRHGSSDISPPATIDSFPITESSYQLGGKIIDEPEETLSSIFTDLNMSSKTDSQTASPTTDQISQTWDESTSQPGGLSPSPGGRHEKSAIIVFHPKAVDPVTYPNPNVVEALKFPDQVPGQLF